MSGPEAPTVEVVYARPERQAVARVRLAPGMTAGDAVDASGILAAHPELRDRSLDLGIFGRPVPRTEILHDGDRVEIYRPLVADPREARRRLVAEGRTSSGTRRGRGHR
ncbi:MAG: RnfH family protein [Steroidobacteraceae bacterium]